MSKNIVNFANSDLLRQASLDLIRLFAEICEKEKLTYYMLGGTMLGAVRHKGFIPWDDDTDFGMPRPDYEKFLAVAGKYLPSYYKLAAFLGTGAEKAPSYHRQLVDIRRKLQFDFGSQSRVGYIFIDIFPLDGMPGNRLLREIQKVRLLYQRMMLVISNFDEGAFIRRPNRPWYERLLIYFVQRFRIQRFLSKEKRYFKLDRTLKSFSYERSKYLVNMMSAYKFKEMFPKSVFGTGRFYEFEDMMLKGPQDHKTYLTQLYGDYMTPPPVSERDRHYTTFAETELSH